MQKQIFIVDDEPEIRNILRLAVTSFNKDWEIKLFALPSEVIAALQHQQPDLVISDQTMPEMTGSQLLDRVRTLAPAAVRILISGHISQFDRISAAHQYLEKPFSFSDLSRRIKQALDAQRYLQNPSLRTIVAGMQSLPVIPQAYVELVQEIDQPNADFDRVIQIVSEDSGICTKILQVANSGLFGCGRRIHDPADAVYMLGSERVLALVLSLHIFKDYDHICFPEMEISKMWQNSWATANLARKIALQSSQPEVAANQAFFAGLMHGVGKLILIENFTKRFREAYQAAQRSQKSLFDAEREVFQATHAEIGAFILQLWGVEEEVIKAVIHQERPWEQSATEFTPATAVYLAESLIRRDQNPDGLSGTSLNMEYLRRTGAPEIEDIDCYSSVASGNACNEFAMAGA